MIFASSLRPEKEAGEGRKTMASSMLDSILALVTPEMKQALATRLGEAPQAVESGLGMATAATLAGLAKKAGDTTFLGQIINMASGTSGQNILGSLSSLASSGPSGAVADLANRFLPLVFARKLDPMSGMLSQKAGVRAASMNVLLRIAAPLVIGFLGKLHSSGCLGVGSLSGMLRGEAPTVEDYAPANLFSAATQRISGANLGVEGRLEPKKSALWLVVVGVLAATLLSWLVYRALEGGRLDTRSAKNSATNVGNNPTMAAGSAANAASPALGEFFKLKLPDGAELNVPQLGVESKLMVFIQDPASGVDTETWLDFDRLQFDSGKATLQQASQEQLRNIARILRAYPNVMISIGGYADTTGDAGVKLSQERAASVMAALVLLGIDPSRMAAKGYGGDYPVGDNTTEEGRQKNRRISMRVTAK
jgi:OmpA-OmpF porin, OOP family